MSDGLRGPGLLQTCGTLDARDVVGIKGLPLGAPSPEISGEFVERILSAGGERKAENSQEEEASFHACAILLDKAGEVNVNAGSCGKWRVEEPRKPALSKSDGCGTRGNIKIPTGSTALGG